MIYERCKMKRKVKELLDSLVKEISTWNYVDTITVAETAEEDLLSPYFFLSIDIYYKKEIPSAQVRQQSFKGADLFESSYFGSKDRFLLNDIPIRLEYKSIERIEALLGATEGAHLGNRESGTYLFYRILNNQSLFHRSPWLSKIQEQINNLPKEFWEPIKQAYWSHLEHKLGDLGASVMEEDDLYYLQSLSGFTKILCGLLFVMNKKFEPSGRRMKEQVLHLDRLPENFKGRFTSLIMEDSEYTPERKMEVAQLIARSLIPLL